MKQRDGYEMPQDREVLYRRALRLEWWTLGWMSSIIVVIYLTMGNSQAMKAAWIEDLLSFVPAVAFLVASRFRNRRPSEDFPYGYHRSISIAFLCAAVALFAMGSYAIIDSALKLIRQEHATIGTTEILGTQVWLGWVMCVALIYSGVPPVILGRMKLKLAAQIHDKALHADADMNKADWLTALAGVLGIVGIGAGFWWADAVAALFISVEITRDGVKNLRRVIADLMDSAPTTVNGENDDAPTRLLERVRKLPWVDAADIRLREEGHVLTGEVYVVARPDTADLAAKLEQIPELAEDIDWRMYDIVVMPVRRIDSGQGDVPERSIRSVMTASGT